MADEALRQNIRAVLQSSKSAVPLGRLQHDFKMLMGHGIPIGELGFNSLDAFLRSIPDVVSITRNYSGELVCEAVSSRQTEHLAQLVKCQRGSKRASFTKGNAQTRSKGYRYPSQARLVNNWSQQLPANPKLPTKVPLLPTPRVLPTPKTYEVPPRFERQNSGRTVQLSSTRGLTVTINLDQTPHSYPSYQSCQRPDDNSNFGEVFDTDSVDHATYHSRSYEPKSSYSSSAKCSSSSTSRNAAADMYNFQASSGFSRGSQRTGQGFLQNHLCGGPQTENEALHQHREVLQSEFSVLPRREAFRGRGGGGGSEGCSRRSRQHLQRY